MIHVDVRKKNDDFIVETSVDGAGWSTQYILGTTVDRDSDQTMREAAFLGRVFANGCRFAGAEVKSTAFGYPNN